jgi:two-component sensor histidine kinase
LDYAVANVQRAGAFAVLVDRDGVILEDLRMPAAARAGNRLQGALRTRAPYEFENAFKVGENWFVGVPLEEAQLYMLVGWSPVPLGWAELTLALWSLLAPILLWLGGVAAAWYAIDAFVARPLVSLERLARAYARGSETETEERELVNAPVEIASLRRTLAAMAKTLRGREARLSDALKEERALLREINHRVKNNLQMVASILSIQARASTDKAEARGLARAQDRVHLLALAHTRIYESGEVRHVALDVLTQDIVRALIASRQSPEREFVLDLKLEAVRGAVDRAVPYAFLVGEVLLYILENAALDAAKFSIEISLERVADQKAALRISGFDEWPTENASSNALRMMAAFARQMEAEVAYEDNGIRLVWNEPEEAEDIQNV